MNAKETDCLCLLAHQIVPQQRVAAVGNACVASTALPVPWHGSHSPAMLRSGRSPGNRERRGKSTSCPKKMSTCCPRTSKLHHPIVSVHRQLCIRKPARRNERKD